MKQNEPKRSNPIQNEQRYATIHVQFFQFFHNQEGFDNPIINGFIYSSISKKSFGF